MSAKEFKFKNKLKNKLKAGELALGVWSHLGCAMVTEILANLGLDWILFDAEHAPFSLETIATNLRAMSGIDCVPLVRVPSNDPVFIKRVLDIGAMGILIPDIRNKEDAIKAVRACKYPKKGLRGFAATRASVYGLNLNYPEEANEEIIVILHVESMEGVNNIKEILSVDDVDVINLGPGDLSFDMFGVQGRKNRDTSECENAVNEVLKKAIRAADKAGIPVMGRTCMKVIGTDDLILMEGVKERIENIKAGKPPRGMPSWILH